MPAHTTGRGTNKLQFLFYDLFAALIATERATSASVMFLWYQCHAQESEV